MPSTHQPVTNSGSKTADGVICAIPCYLHGVVLQNDGTNASSVVVYDNASAASGTVIAKLALPASSTTLTHPLVFSHPVIANNGLYIDVTGTGCAVHVYYAPGV